MAGRRSGLGEIRRDARPRVEDIKWPGPNEPVTMVAAMMAIAFGNASILARYLREAQPICSGITNLVAFMLDPEGHPNDQADADDYNPTDWCRTWRLEFRRIGRGNQKNMAEVDMRLLSIGMFIESRFRGGSKAKAAKYEAMKVFGISLAQANKALTATRKALGFKARDLSEADYISIEETPEPAPKLPK